jgi:drug/metabolite transporter (DMT)-like permease
MSAVLGGLGAAVMFATGTLCSSRSSRMIGAASVLAWVMLTGLVVNLAVLGMYQVAHEAVHPDASTIGWLVLGGLGNVVGLLLSYSALRRGKVGLVAPIVSTEGALAAVLAVAAGETLGAASALLLLVIAAGVVLAAAAPEDLPVAGEDKARAVQLAVLAAGSFAVSLYATGRVSTRLPLPWVLLPPRVLGVLALTIPLAATHRLRLTRPAVPLVVVAGLCEVLGFSCYVLGARQQIAVAAVLASQFAAFAGVGAYLLFRERLTRLQLGGVSLVVVGVAVLTAVRV